MPREDGGHPHEFEGERGGLVGGGSYQEFAKDGQVRAIYWSPATGAYLVDYATVIGKKWAAAGYERGYGYMFSRHIQQANLGCDFDFLRSDFGAPVAEPAGEGDEPA